MRLRDARVPLFSMETTSIALSETSLCLSSPSTFLRLPTTSKKCSHIPPGNQLPLTIHLANSTPLAIVSLFNSLDPYAHYTLLACRLFLVFNIVMACSPLFRAKDDIEDIPLTPSQRALLGLKPSSAPLTPGQQYITPPRYARSSTPLSNASAQKMADSSPSARPASPSSIDRSPFGQSKGLSGSPYSNSPLVQKALGGASANRRLSYGSSPLDVTGAMPASTTGLSVGKATVGLNSKWLYERGRASPNANPLFT